MRRASNFFKSYHLYENRLPEKTGAALARKTLHQMKHKQYSEIKAVEIPFAPNKRLKKYDYGVVKTKSPWEECVKEFYCENGWARSEGDPVSYISGRMVETFLSEEAFALVYMGSEC